MPTTFTGWDHDNRSHCLQVCISSDCAGYLTAGGQKAIPTKKRLRKRLEYALLRSAGRRNASAPTLVAESFLMLHVRCAAPKVRCRTPSTIALARDVQFAGASSGFGIRKTQLW